MRLTCSALGVGLWPVEPRPSFGDLAVGQVTVIVLGVALAGFGDRPQPWTLQPPPGAMAGSFVTSTRTSSPGRSLTQRTAGCVQDVGWLSASLRCTLGHPISNSTRTLTLSSYVKSGAVETVDNCCRWVQIRSEMRRLSTRRASRLVFPRWRSFW